MHLRKVLKLISKGHDFRIRIHLEEQHFFVCLAVLKFFQQESWMGTLCTILRYFQLGNRCEVTLPLS